MGGTLAPWGVLGTDFKSRARRVCWRVGCGSRSVHVSGLEHGRSRPGAAVRVNTAKATCRAAWRAQELGWVTACQADGRMSWPVPSLGIVLSRGARHRARGCVHMSVCTHTCSEGSLVPSCWFRIPALQHRSCVASGSDLATLCLGFLTCQVGRMVAPQEGTVQVDVSVHVRRAFSIRHSVGSR